MALISEGRFLNRMDAGERLAKALEPLKGKHPLVLGIPRGGVTLGRVIADRLGGDLDVVLVRKLGAPGYEEFAVGAIDESGHLQLSEDAAQVGADARYIKQEAARQLDRIWQRRRLYSPHHAGKAPAGRVVIVVDDGLATGATMRAALTAMRRQSPARLIAAIPVASPRSLASIQALADDVICLEAPADFRAVGQYYESFPAVEDSEVIHLLQRGENADALPEGFQKAMQFKIDGLVLEGDLQMPPHVRGLVIFAHGSGSSRRSSRGGRPDLAGADTLRRVHAPTLLLVGSADHQVIPLNKEALRVMPDMAELVLIPGATHLFEEPGALERVPRWRPIGSRIGYSAAWRPCPSPSEASWTPSGRRPFR